MEIPTKNKKVYTERDKTDGNIASFLISRKNTKF